MNAKELETKLTEAQNKIKDWAGNNLTAQQAKELFLLIDEATRTQCQISVEVTLDAVLQKVKGAVIT